MELRAGKADMFWPLVLLAFLTLAAVVSAGLILVAEIDKVAAQREQTVVANGIRGRMNEIGHLIDGQAVWDEAVRHLDNHFDQEWARDNTGAVPCQIDGFEESFILDREGRPLMAFNKNGQADLRLYERFASSIASLVKSVRAVEAEHGSSLIHPRAGQVINNSNVASGLANIGGQVYIVSAMVVEPDFGRATLRGTRAPIIVTAMRIDERFVDVVAQRFLLKQVHLYTGVSPRGSPAASVTLLSDMGGYVATLNWVPQTPGRKLLRRVGPPTLAILIALATSVTLLYRRGRRIANNLMMSESRATHLAYHDALTGLPNRVLFYDRLAHALKQMRRTGDTLAVYCLDLDRFKAINDTYGHHVGDELIQKVSRMMVARCGRADTVARLSGDEFAIFQNCASAATAASFASSLARAMREPIELEAGLVFIGCSVGVTLVSDSDLQPAEILRRADLALYRSKDTAKGQFCFFEPEMDATIKVRRALEADLRVALAEGNLHMVYQPQVNDCTGVTGVEALMRWHHPERGNVSPAIFVPVAEDCGLIVELGMFALRQAFMDSKRWKGINVAVNISAKQLRMKDFVSKLMELVAEVGVNPQKFELEITEGILLGDDPDTHAMLCQLRDYGFSLAFDDFGTGYSSLSYLQRYPINRIKIDQSFTTNLGVSDEAEAFIAAIVKLARALRLSVIAEGVETALQHDRLASAGCTDMQGYLFGKPVAADEIDLLLASSSRVSVVS